MCSLGSCRSTIELHPRLTISRTALYYLPVLHCIRRHYPSVPVPRQGVRDVAWCATACSVSKDIASHPLWSRTSLEDRRRQFLVPRLAQSVSHGDDAARADDGRFRLPAHRLHHSIFGSFPSLWREIRVFAAVPRGYAPCVPPACRGSSRTSTMQRPRLIAVTSLHLHQVESYTVKWVLRSARHLSESIRATMVDCTSSIEPIGRIRVTVGHEDLQHDCPERRDRQNDLAHSPGSRGGDRRLEGTARRYRSASKHHRLVAPASGCRAGACPKSVP